LALPSGGEWGKRERGPAAGRPAFPAAFALEAALGPLAPEDLRPLPLLEDRHVPAGPDLEWLLAAPEIVELVAVRFAESFEPARIDEVAHRDAVDLERLLLDGIGDFIRVEGPVRCLGGEGDGRVGEQLREFVRRRDAERVRARASGPVD